MFEKKSEFKYKAWKKSKTQNDLFILVHCYKTSNLGTVNNSFWWVIKEKWKISLVHWNCNCQTCFLIVTKKKKWIIQLNKISYTNSQEISISRAEFICVPNLLRNTSLNIECCVTKYWTERIWSLLRWLKKYYTKRNVNFTV